MLLTFNLKFIKSNTAGRHHVWFQSSGWPPGKDVWENRSWDIVGWWLAPSPSGSLPGLCWWAGVFPIRQPRGKPSSPWLLCSDSQSGEINSACLLLAVSQMRLTCWALPLLRVGSSATHGSRGCLMRLTGSCNICYTPGQACSAPSKGGWWLSPSFWPSFLHQGQWVMPLKWQRASGSCMPTSPITFGDSQWGYCSEELKAFR